MTSREEQERREREARQEDWGAFALGYLEAKREMAGRGDGY